MKDLFELIYNKDGLVSAELISVEIKESLELIFLIATAYKDRWSNNFTLEYKVRVGQFEGSWFVNGANPISLLKGDMEALKNTYGPYWLETWDGCGRMLSDDIYGYLNSLQMELLEKAI